MLSAHMRRRRIVADGGAYAALVIFRIPGRSFDERSLLAFTEFGDGVLSDTFYCHRAILAARSARYADVIVTRPCRK
jgi:hypothetical protein